MREQYSLQQFMLFLTDLKKDLKENLKNLTLLHDRNNTISVKLATCMLEKSQRTHAQIKALPGNIEDYLGNITKSMDLRFYRFNSAEYLIFRKFNNLVCFFERMKEEVDRNLLSNQENKVGELIYNVYKIINAMSHHISKAWEPFWINQSHKDFLEKTKARFMSQPMYVREFDPKCWGLFLKGDACVLHKAQVTFSYKNVYLIFNNYASEVNLFSQPGLCGIGFVLNDLPHQSHETLRVVRKIGKSIIECGEHAGKNVKQIFPLFLLKSCSNFHSYSPSKPLISSHKNSVFHIPWAFFEVEYISENNLGRLMSEQDILEKNTSDESTLNINDIEELLTFINELSGVFKGCNVAKRIFQIHMQFLNVCIKERASLDYLRRIEHTFLIMLCSLFDRENLIESLTSNKPPSAAEYLFNCSCLQPSFKFGIEKKGVNLQLECVREAVEHAQKYVQDTDYRFGMLIKAIFPKERMPPDLRQDDYWRWQVKKVIRVLDYPESFWWGLYAMKRNNLVNGFHFRGGYIRWNLTDGPFVHLIDCLEMEQRCLFLLRANEAEVFRHQFSSGAKLSYQTLKTWLADAERFDYASEEAHKQNFVMCEVYFKGGKLDYAHCSRSMPDVLRLSPHDIQRLYCAAMDSVYAVQRAKRMSRPAQLAAQEALQKATQQLAEARGAEAIKEEAPVWRKKVEEPDESANWVVKGVEKAFEFMGFVDKPEELSRWADPTYRQQWEAWGNRTDEARQQLMRAEREVKEAEAQVKQVKAQAEKIEMSEVEWQNKKIQDLFNECTTSDHTGNVPISFDDPYSLYKALDLRVLTLPF